VYASASKLSATLCKAVVTVLRYIAALWSKAARRRASYAARCPHHCLRHVAGHGPKGDARSRNELADYVRGGGGIRGERELRQLSGGGDADLSTGRMQLRLGRLDKGTLLDRFRRQSDQ
jgi:hypothetical protein